MTHSPGPARPGLRPLALGLAIAVPLGVLLGVAAWFALAGDTCWLTGGCEPAAAESSSPGDTPSAEPSGTATGTSVTTAARTVTLSTVTTTATASQARTPTPAIERGIDIVVRNTVDCLNLRPGPSTSQKQLTCLVDGTEGRVLDGPVQAEGFRWWRLEVASYQGKRWDGWVAEAPATGPPWLVRR